MYFYVFDSFLQDKKYQPELLRIESRLSTLGLQGRSEKMTILKNIQEATQQAIKRGATTVVIVGNDQTVTKLLPTIIEAGVTLGLIPFGQPNTIASYLGLPSGVGACDILSRRIIRKLDVGQIDKQYFLLQATLTAPAKVMCDGHYTVETLNPTDECVIANLGHHDPVGQPTDGKLELIVQPTQSGWSPFRQKYSSASVFPLRRAKIQSTGAAGSIVLDGQTVLRAPATVEVATKRLEVIVGRDRHF